MTERARSTDVHHIRASPGPECTYRLDLTGVDLDDPDPGGDELLAQTLGEAAHSGLACTVDGAAGVGLSACRHALSVLRTSSCCLVPAANTYQRRSRR